MAITDTLYQILVYGIPLIFAITLHEAAHGLAAKRYGDDTAFMLGRVTANPIPHIDLVGTILVPGVLLLGSALTGLGGVLLGWAKPVPINTRKLNPFRKGMLMVALAGPLSNFCQALVWFIFLKAFINSGMLTQSLLDITVAGVLVNFYIMAFNLLPLPPLDGGRIVTMLLPYNAAQQFARLEQYGMIFLVVLIMSGLLNYWMQPFVYVGKNLLSFVGF